MAVDLFPSWIIARNAYPDRKPEVQVSVPLMRRYLPGRARPGCGGLPLLRRGVRSRAGSGEGGQGHLPALRHVVRDHRRDRRDRDAARVPALRQTRADPGGHQGVSPGHGRRSCTPTGNARPVCGRKSSAATSCCPPWPWRTAINTRQAIELRLPDLERLLQRPPAPGPGVASSRHRADRGRAVAGRAVDLVLGRPGVQQPVRLVQGRGDRCGAAHVLAPHPQAGADADRGERVGHAQELRLVFQPLPEPPAPGDRLPAGRPRRSAPAKVARAGCSPCPSPARSRTTSADGRPVRGKGDLPVVRRLGRHRTAGSEHRPDRDRPAVLRQRLLLGARGLLPRLAGAVAGIRVHPRARPRPSEVQDSNAGRFRRQAARRLPRVPARILKDDGLLVFTYHHSRDEGWKALADAVLGAGLHRGEFPAGQGRDVGGHAKSQAKEPIQLDIIIVCRKTRPRAGHLGHRRSGHGIRQGEAGPTPRGGVRAIPQRSQDRRLRPAPDDARVTRRAGFGQPSRGGIGRGGRIREIHDRIGRATPPLRFERNDSVASAPSRDRSIPAPGRRDVLRRPTGRRDPAQPLIPLG